MYNNDISLRMTQGQHGEVSKVEQELEDHENEMERMCEAEEDDMQDSPAIPLQMAGKRDSTPSRDNSVVADETTTTMNCAISDCSTTSQSIKALLLHMKDQHNFVYHHTEEENTHFHRFDPSDPDPWVMVFNMSKLTHQFAMGLGPTIRQRTDSSNEEKQKRGRSHLPKEATGKLKAWYRAHIQHSYPTDDEKQELVRQTGLQSNQIKYWFSNTRRRRLPMNEVYEQLPVGEDILEC